LRLPLPRAVAHGAALVAAVEGDEPADRRLGDGERRQVVEAPGCGLVDDLGWRHAGLPGGDNGVLHRAAQLLVVPAHTRSIGWAVDGLGGGLGAAGRTGQGFRSTSSWSQWFRNMIDDPSQWKVKRGPLPMREEKTSCGPRTSSFLVRRPGVRSISSSATCAMHFMTPTRWSFGFFSKRRLNRLSVFHL
jgi:hypothetical protein